MKTLWTLPDVLDLVLPKAIKDAIFMTPELKDAIISAVVEQLLEKDLGVLRAIELLLESEDLRQDAEAIRQLQACGCGLNGDQVSRKVSDCLRALLAEHLPPKLVSDLGRMFQYLSAKSDQRRELLAGGLFVRCAAAVLCGGCTGELEVEAAGGAGACCEYSEVTQVLQINVGGDKAEQQLTHVATIAAYTLDRALVAVRSAAAAGTLLLPQDLPHDPPSRLYVHGTVRHVVAARHMQQQQQAQGQRKRRELGGEALSRSPPGGLEGAALVLTTVVAGSGRDPASARGQHVPILPKRRKVPRYR